MVTPTPGSRARTTEDLFAAIHRYHDAFPSPSSTITSTSLLQLSIYNSSCSFSSRTLFVFLSYPSRLNVRFPPFHPLVNPNASLWTPPSHNFSFNLHPPPLPHLALHLSVITLPQRCPISSRDICQIEDLWIKPRREQPPLVPEGTTSGSKPSQPSNVYGVICDSRVTLALLILSRRRKAAASSIIKQLDTLRS